MKKKTAMFMLTVISVLFLTLAVQCPPQPFSIIGDWSINGVFDFYTTYPTIISQDLTNTITYNSDGTFSQTGSSGGVTMLGSGTYVYDGLAATLDQTFDVWEMPIGTPGTPPVVPTSGCVIDATTMTVTMTPTDYTWVDPLVYTRL